MRSQRVIEQHIVNQIQENLNLDYKAAAALAKSDGASKEISKDISAMANSQGGAVIYGIKEFDEEEKRHLPEKIDPVDQTIFTKEWVEQIINGNIRPRIQGVIIHPVQIDTDPSHCVYVVEIPASNTAHQAKDKRYYKRYNFESIAMEDYEIRDVMNRANVPDVSIQLGLFHGDASEDGQGADLYRGLNIIIKNEGTHVVEKFKVILTLTNVGWFDDDGQHIKLVKILKDEATGLKVSTQGNFDHSADFFVVYQSEFVLFPQEQIDIGKMLAWGYKDDLFHEADNTWNDFARDSEWEIKWKLYADNMPLKSGNVLVGDLPILNRFDDR